MMMPIRITPAVKFLLIACVGAFVVQQSVDQFMGGNLLGWLALVPSSFAFEFRFWQLITYSFLHGDVMHLFLNLLMLAFIGGELEAVWGTKKFLRYYFFCVVAAGLLYLFLQIFVWKGTGLITPMVGASGGIYGLLTAYGILFGERVMLFMLLFPMKAKHFVWILGAIAFFSMVFSGRGGLSAAAHLGGMVAGFGYLWTKAWMQVRRRNRQSQVLGNWLKTNPKAKAKPKKSHLRLVSGSKKDLDREMDEDNDRSDPKTWH